VFGLVIVCVATLALSALVRNLVRAAGVGVPDEVQEEPAPLPPVVSAYSLGLDLTVPDGYTARVIAGEIDEPVDQPGGWSQGMDVEAVAVADVTDTSGSVVATVRLLQYEVDPVRRHRSLASLLRRDDVQGRVETLEGRSVAFEPERERITWPHSDRAIVTVTGQHPGSFEEVRAIAAALIRGNT
jgi:hypothetical protein